MTPLAPAPQTATCRRHGRMPYAFAPRFFIALIAGAVWLGAAWWDARFAGIMLVWDVLVIAAYFADFRRLPTPSEIEITREWPDAVTLDAESVVVLRLANHSARAFHADLTDTVPAGWRPRPPQWEMQLAANDSAEGRYFIRPLQRGDASLGAVYVRVQSSFLLAERWMRADLAQTSRVYPNLEASRRLTMHLIRSRQVQIERRMKRLAGQGREFESLREYRAGDERRDICWTATARRAQLITKTYQPERSQAVIVVVDAGRLMLARAGEEGSPWTKLDFAASAALALAHVALSSGDPDRTPCLRPQSSSAHRPQERGVGPVRAMLDSLAVMHGELSEAART